VISFEQFMNKPRGCPACNRLWDFTKMGTKKFRIKDVGE